MTLIEQFLSTPSGWRATVGCKASSKRTGRFLSTPSGWRATAKLGVSFAVHRPISIHALRVEGDTYLLNRDFKKIYFYPRPPGGGRLQRRCRFRETSRFLSTPSGWRATRTYLDPDNDSIISIHALRVEGDSYPAFIHKDFLHFYPRSPGGGRHPVPTTDTRATYFYPRPPGGGRRRDLSLQYRSQKISIHALRVEGDGDDPLPAARRGGISIHALRVEGDQGLQGRRVRKAEFLSTPSGWRATTPESVRNAWFTFLSTPSGWRATGADKVVPSVAVFLSTPSGWRATRRASTEVSS